jgi:hypothetical protein
MNRRLLVWLAAFGALTSLPLAAGAQMSETQFPVGSRLGLKPPAGFALSTTFSGFEDSANSAFIRLVALPSTAFGEIEKTVTNEALKKQGLVIEKRETPKLAGGKSLLVIARQDTNAGRIRKWLLIAPVADVTAMISFEISDKSKASYSDASIRTALSSVTARATVPAEEQLSLVPFKLSELAGLRVAGVVPGRAVQLTDGPKDIVDAIDQAYIVIGAAPGGPQQPAERDSFARLALGSMPNLKDVQILGAEAMRVGGQPGHEIRAAGKDKTGTEVEIVQWMRFGSGGYMRMLGFAPKERWTQAFTKFRAVRDGIEPR